MKAALRVSRNYRAHLSDFYVAPWSACLHAVRVTPGTRKAVLRPLPRFNCSNGMVLDQLTNLSGGMECFLSFKNCALRLKTVPVCLA